MKRVLLVVLIWFGLASAAFAGLAANSMPDTDTLSKECYAKVGPLLRLSKGAFTPEARNAYLDWAEQTVLKELHQNNQSVPEDCLAEVRQNDTLRVAMYGSVFPPDASIVQNYAELRTQLDGRFLSNYRSLIIGVSVAKRIKQVESDDEIKRIGKDYQGDFWLGKSLQLPSSEDEKVFIRHIAEFMTQSHASALDLYQDEALQKQLRSFLDHQTVRPDLIAEVKKSVQFGERIKNAMILLHQRPATRDAQPDTVTWLRYLAKLMEAEPTSTPTFDGKAMQWPLFPMDTAPWPLLMPLAHAVPLREANYIWEAFQGEHGPDRYHTYGPYREADAVVPDSLRPSEWFWDAWPDRIVHGGECVPISIGTVDLYSALSKPAMWAGQPGHANLISFQYVGGTWTAEIEQAFYGGPNVTYAQWYFNEDPGTMIRFRDLYYWPGAEYQLGLALGMNVGLKSYLDTRIAANLFRVLPVSEKRGLGVELLHSVLKVNPFNPDIWYRLAEQLPDTSQRITLAEAAVRGTSGLVPTKSGAATASGQYWRTVALCLTQNSILTYDVPVTEAEMRHVCEFLKTVPDISPEDLGAYDEKFAENISANASASELDYDRSLAAHGDSYGELRMGQRYRDGDGVTQNILLAKEWLTKSSLHGDMGAASILAKFNPTIPANQIAITASSEYTPTQGAGHLIDGTGMVGPFHDNAVAAETMWHTDGKGVMLPPDKALPASPAWVRFDFQQPMQFDSMLIWNHNQANLTDRGFRMTRVYGSPDGITWMPITATPVIELPRATGLPLALPATIPNQAPRQALKAVVIAAEATNGNYGGTCFGLSAVRFVAPRLPNVIPESQIMVTASSVFTPGQAAEHLIDGSGMVGALHDNAGAAQTMWHDNGKPAILPPAHGLPRAPAWVRFDFKNPKQFDSILIWNHNQANLTDRGFRKVRIYGSLDGTNWRSLTSSEIVEIPRANGLSNDRPSSVSNILAERLFKSVIIAADETDGNYGGTCFGLSAVRFVRGRQK